MYNIYYISLYINVISPSLKHHHCKSLGATTLSPLDPGIPVKIPINPHQPSDPRPKKYMNLQEKKHHMILQ